MSFVVPTRNSARTLEACLRSLRAQCHDDVEIVVVDNRSEDATVQIAVGLADRVEAWGPERSAQRNRGAAISTGDVVVFVDSDMVLEPRVAAEAAALLASDASVGAAVLPERAFGQGPWAAGRVLEKELYLGATDVEAARAFRWAAFAAVGGYDEAMWAFEDWDLPDRVAGAGWRVGRLQAGVWHDEGRVRLRQAFVKKRYYGRGAPTYLSRPGRRRIGRRALLGRPGRLLGSPLRAGALGVLKAVEAAGFVHGAWLSRRAGRG